MSSGLAISAVTCVLQAALNDMYSAAKLPGTVKVTCLAPDQVQSTLGDLSGAENQVNLFLHQVTHNAAWRNVDLPSLAADGRTRLKCPPLALDLHYLLTVYGSDDWQAESLLGYALMLLHENPVLARAEIAQALAKLTTSPEPYPGNPLTNYLAASGLADQVEMLKIAPETMGREEMAWLWTALKADYRPTYPFQVTVVLIQPQLAVSVAMPVMRRDLIAVPMQPAQILSVSPPLGEAFATGTDLVTVAGEFLNTITQVSLANTRYGIFQTIAITGAFPGGFTFTPDPALALPAGVYSLSAETTDAATSELAQSTPPITFPLAPILPDQAATVVADAEGKNVTISFSPSVVEGQDVSLVLSARAAPPPPGPVYTSAAPAEIVHRLRQQPDLSVPPDLPSGALLGRLIVDGVPSNVTFDASVTPAFTHPLVSV